MTKSLLKHLLKFVGRPLRAADARRFSARHSQHGESGERVRLAYVTHLPITQWLFLEGQNAYMTQQGFELHALCSPGRRLDDLVERDGVIPHPVPIARTIAPLRDFVSLIRLFFALRRLRPDIVHLSTPKGALLGALAAWLARIQNRVYLVRGFTSAQVAGTKHHVFRRLERLTARLCTSTVCNAPSLLTYGRANGILRQSEGIVLRSGMSNGVAVEHYRAGVVEAADLDLEANSANRKRIPVVGFVGRVAQDKGIEVLAQAWSVVRNEFPDALLLLVGPWETEDMVPEHIRQSLQSDPQVILTGAVDDVRPFYQAMTVFVLPSIGEGFPNSAMEAAAMCLPVVTTDTVGCRDAVVDGVTGTLTPPSDAVALARAVGHYLTNSEIAARHGAAGRQRVVQSFRQELIWDSMFQHYQLLLHRTRDPRSPANPAAPPLMEDVASC